MTDQSTEQEARIVGMTIGQAIGRVALVAFVLMVIVAAATTPEWH